MNAKQWRQHGYKTIFRTRENAVIYLYRPLTDVVISTHVRNGKWMEYDNVNEHPWGKWTLEDHRRRPDLLPLLKSISETCYCDQGVNICDFCAGIREAKEYVESIKEGE